jgi:hypothetical protein
MASFPRTAASIGAVAPPLVPRGHMYAAWKDSEDLCRIEYSRAVFEEIRAEATRGLLGLGHGGFEIGGLLFGTRLGHQLRITAWRPITCCHAMGPSFVLTLQDEVALARQIASSGSDPSLSELQVLGWFVSHARRELELSPEEHAFSARHFLESWQVALVLKPERFGDSEARLYARPAAAEPLEPRSPFLRIESAPNLAARPRNARHAAAPDAAALQRAPSPSGGSRQWLNWVVAIALCAGLTGSAMAAYRGWRQVTWAETPAPLRLPSLRLDEGAPILRLAWDPSSDYIARASQAWFEIREDGVIKTIQLDRDALLTGEYHVATAEPAGSVTLALRAGANTPVFETVRWGAEKK